MKQFRFFCLLIIFAFLQSCAISKYVAPPFTDLDKILALKYGQEPNEVYDILKIKPYDVVYSHEKSKMLLVYNYRVKDRRMVLPTKTASQVVHSENAQRQGDVWYNANYREVYLLFQDGKLSGIYGEDVLAIGGQVEVMDNHLDGIENKLGSSNTNPDLLFARNVYTERSSRKSAELSEDMEAKRRRKFMLGVASAGAFVLLLLLGV